VIDILGHLVLPETIERLAVDDAVNDGCGCRTKEPKAILEKAFFIMPY
jgi:hypothetical protein